MEICPLSDDELQLNLVYFCAQQTPAIYKLDSGATKYHPPNFVSGESKVPHYRLLKILNSMNKQTLEADALWWANRLRVKGVPGAAWMGAILASAMDLLWRAFTVWRSAPSFVHKKLNLSLAEGCKQWVQSLLDIKNQYYCELRKLAELEPELVWTKLEPISAYRAGSPEPKISSSDKDTPTLPIEDPIMEA